MKKLIIGLVFGCAVLLTGCTQNQMAKNYGGAARIDIAAGQKVVNLTWKEDSLWILTRPRRADETPETYNFKEDSSYGVWQGTVTIVEK